MCSLYRQALFLRNAKGGAWLIGKKLFCFLGDRQSHGA